MLNDLPVETYEVFEAFKYFLSAMLLLFVEILIWFEKKKNEKWGVEIKEELSNDRSFSACFGWRWPIQKQVFSRKNKNCYFYL